MNFRFELTGINVVDDHKHRLGRVENYTLDPESFLIQQLYLKPGVMKSLSVSHLTVSRNQIIAIDNSKITVKSPTVREKAVQKAVRPAPVPGNFENPFRKPKPVAEHVEVK